MKKIAMLVAAPLLLMGLSACDKKTDNNADTMAPTTPATSSTAIAPAPVAPTPMAPTAPTAAPADTMAPTSEMAPSSDTMAPAADTMASPDTQPDGAARATPGQVPSGAQPNADTMVKEKN